MHSVPVFRRLVLALALAGVPALALAQAQPAAPAPPAAPAAPPAAPQQAQPAPAPAPAAPAIKIGSVVQLQSGGPQMTVVGLTPVGVVVLWYVESAAEFKRAEFPLAAVKLTTEDDEEDDEDEDEDEDDEDE